MKNFKSTFLLNRFNLACLIFIVNSYSGIGQENEIKDSNAFKAKIEILNKKISNSTKQKKLFWLDSLSKLIHFKTAYDYEPIVRQTIKLAIANDSLNKAAFHTGNLQNYYNNIIGEPEKAIAIFDSLYPKLLKSNESNKASLYLNLGDSYLFLGNSKKAVNCYKQAYAYADKAGSEKLKAFSLLYQSEILGEAGDFLKTSQYLVRASDIFYKLKDTFNIISAKNSLLFLYGKNGFYKEADKVRNEAIHLAEATHSYGQLASLYSNRANDEKKQDNYPLKLHFLKKALDNCRKSKYEATMEPGILSSMIGNYALNNQLQLAEKHLDTLLLKYPGISHFDKRKVYLNAIRRVAFAKGDYNQSLSLSKEQLAIERKFNHTDCIQDLELFLAQVYEKMGDYRQSSYHFKEYNQIKDSVFSVQKANAMIYYQALYENEKKDRKIEMQQSSISLLKSKSNLKNLWIFIGILLLLGLFAFLWTLRSRNFAKRHEIQQEQFSQQLIKTQENERIRLARDLHDGVGQKLMLLTKKAKEVNMDDPDNLADSTLEELRNISKGLYPVTIEKLGITSALRNMFDEIDRNSPILFDYELDNIDEFVDKDTALQLFRIMQEVLNNIIKHSQTNEASIAILKQGKAIEASIIDSGIGFNINHASEALLGMGMKTIQERVKIIKGTIIINSKPNKGTQVYLTLPVKK